MNNNDKLRLYRVDVEYVRALRKVDENVEDNSPENHKDKRAYVGVVIICDNNKYCIPLTSPKPKHQRMKNNVDFTKLVGKKGNPLGALNFNNMIPVDDRVISMIDTKINENDCASDIKYKRLVAEQIDWCNRNHDKIIYKANKLYKMITESPEKYKNIAKRCCDFLSLEIALQEYIKQQPLRKDLAEQQAQLGYIKSHVQSTAEEQKVVAPQQTPTQPKKNNGGRHI